MDPEVKNCQNCKRDFLLEADDFGYLKKFNMPFPTFCPICRRQRRMSYRNERTLYKRKCNAPGHNEDIISVFSSDPPKLPDGRVGKPFTVYDDRYWWSDAWDPMDYGKEYDFNRPFFTQFRELLERVPLINLSITNMANCSFCNVSEGDKECYLISASEQNEKVMYGNRVLFNKDSVDLYATDHCEICYDLNKCSHCYDTKYAYKAIQCQSSAFLYDCANCSNCFMCSNLKNRSYCIRNTQYGREEYADRMKEANLSSYATISFLKKEFREMRQNAIHRFAYILRSENSTGDNLLQTKNCVACFDFIGPVEDCRYAHWGGAGLKDCCDCGPGVGISAEQMYESWDAGIKGSRIFFSGVLYGSTDAYYSINCHGSKNLFGCYGIRGGEYCILNKRYSKESFDTLKAKIIKHMNEMPYIDRKGRIYKYGEFFPVEISPFCYNESISQDYEPLTKERAEELGFPWKETEERGYQITKEPEDIPDNIKDIDDSILQEVIGCAHGGRCEDGCSNAFRVIPEELKFYRFANVPLPRHCFNCRHHERLAVRNPMQLWKRTCMCSGLASSEEASLPAGRQVASRHKNTAEHFHGESACPNEFMTSFAPDRPEVVYCESCYQAEVA